MGTLLTNERLSVREEIRLESSCDFLLFLYFLSFYFNHFLNHFLVIFGARVVALTSERHDNCLNSDVGSFLEILILACVTSLLGVSVLRSPEIFFEIILV